MHPRPVQVGLVPFPLFLGMLGDPAEWKWGIFIGCQKEELGPLFEVSYKCSSTQLRVPGFVCMARKGLCVTQCRCGAQAAGTLLANGCMCSSSQLRFQFAKSPFYLIITG